jgi:hypothetical protein
MKQHIDKLIGRDISGDYYWLEYVFEDSSDFRGAVGSVFRPVSVTKKEERMTPENAREWLAEGWREAVKAGTTEQSLDDYIQNVIDIDGESAFFDQSYFDTGCKIAEIYNSELPKDADESEQAEFSDCGGGGRCFNQKIVWNKIYDQEALTLALSYETD